MAVWNSMVRGHVIAIRNSMGWDPTDIVDRTNPMPTAQNRNGMGSMLESAPDPAEKSMPKMDEAYIPKVGRASDPNAGMGRY